MTLMTASKPIGLCTALSGSEKDTFDLVTRTWQRPFFHELEGAMEKLPQTAKDVINNVLASLEFPDESTSHMDSKLLQKSLVTICRLATNSLSDIKRNNPFNIYEWKTYPQEFDLKKFLDASTNEIDSLEKRVKSQNVINALQQISTKLQSEMALTNADL